MGKLSNTATPIYYGQFRDEVLKGNIPVCREIAMEMNRIDDLIANPGVYYDEDAVKGFIAYCENELTLTDGSAMSLLPTFKLWAEQIFGWYYFVERSVYVPGENGQGHYVRKHIKKRLINKQYLIVARGAAKSMYGSCLQNFFLNVDTSTTHQITTAPTMKQAEEVLSPIRTAITRARGPFFKFLTEGSVHNTKGGGANKAKLAATKKGIENFMTGSLLEIRPMSINKLQGLQCKVATVDEWLSGDLREDVVGAIEQGASKVDDYIIVAISSEGTVRNGAGDTIKMELMDILKGDYINPHVSIWWYKLDDIQEVADPAMWLKANPNLGRTVTYETYQLDVERAEKAPASRNDILAKRFGIPMEGYTYYFTYEETLPHRYRTYWQMPCSLGADLSQGDDFCSFTFLFPLANGDFGVKTRNYISENTLMKLPAAMRLKYEEFMKEGTLIIMPGTILDMMDIYDDLDQFIVDCGYDVVCFGYDPYNAKDFVERWTRENGPFGVEKVIQGVKTESVPLGELKKLSEDRRLLFDEALMTFAMGNCITLEDTNGNRKLLKKRQDAKIDAVAAMMDAFVAYKLNREAFELRNVMSYYELFNSNASQGSELYHSASSEYELYHHGVKGQKWGVRREKKKAASRKARAKKAGERIKNSGGSKGLAAAKRFGLGYLRNVGQNFIASGAASTTMTIAMNTVSPPIAAAAFATTTAIALTNAGFNIQNIYSTGRDIYDIAKHEDNSEYLAHHGIKGQRWGIRRFQDESGALTGLGKLRSTTDADWHPPKKELYWRFYDGSPQ